MSRRGIWILAAVSCVAAPLLLAAAQAGSKEIGEVFVTNFPETQKIDGTVTVGAPIPQAALASIKDVLVSPVSPQDSSHLVFAGTIVTDGFGAVVLSLTGVTRGYLTKSGPVGAILVPEEEGILKLLEDRGLVQFPIEVAATGVSNSTPYFSSAQVRSLLAFPKYRVFLYNGTDRSVTVTLYAYLMG